MEKILECVPTLFLEENLDLLLDVVLVLVVAGK